MFIWQIIIKSLPKRFTKGKTYLERFAPGKFSVMRFYIQKVHAAVIHTQILSISRFLKDEPSRLVQQMLRRGVFKPVFM